MAARVQFWLLLALPCGWALAQPPAHTAKVGVIDIQSVLARTRAGQKATEDLAAKAAPKRKELIAKEDEISALREQLRTGGVAFSDASKQNLYREIDRKVESLRREADEA